MYFRENPVLQRELLLNLRRPRAFVLQLLYVLALAAAVYLAWPEGAGAGRPNFAAPGASQRLFTIFFLGQFVLVALMAPSFAAGSLTGEKERKTYEMLLASPLSPAAVLIGKLLSSLCSLAILVFSSAPMMVLCFVMGGIGMDEIVMAYVVLLLAAGTFGLISLACSSVFQRTSSALVVSYLAILPLTLIGVGLGGVASPDFRIFAGIVALPPVCLMIWLTVILLMRQRLLHPADAGDGAAEVVDDDQRAVVGLTINRELFPDKLFAPAKRTDWMPDGINPVLDKELRSEIFAQGTLMLRLVIQVSLFLAIPLMACFLMARPHLAGYYVCYVVLFNMLVGPVFSAGAVTQERERQTLALLLTTLLTPSQIIGAKLLASLRVSTMLTLLLAWPLLLATLSVGELRHNLGAFLLFIAIIATTCLATTTLGLFFSTLCRKTLTAMIGTYLTVLLLFLGPVGLGGFLEVFFQGVSYRRLGQLSITSPFAAALSVPLATAEPGLAAAPLRFPVYLYYLTLYPLACGLVILATNWLFSIRWRSAGEG